MKDRDLEAHAYMVQRLMSEGHSWQAAVDIADHHFGVTTW